MVGASVRLETAMLTHSDVEQAREVLAKWRNNPAAPVTPAVEAAWDVMDLAALEGLLDFSCETDPMLDAWESVFDPE